MPRGPRPLRLLLGDDRDQLRELILLPTGCIVLFTAEPDLAGRARALGATGVVSEEPSVPDVADALDAAC